MSATPSDAELILRLYDLRREAVMRQARDDVFTKFKPLSFDDVAAVQKREHPLNTAYRMVSSYWEMAAGFARHGALNLELFAENCGEGLALYAKMLPHVERLRKDYAPNAYKNIEWVVAQSPEAKSRLELFVQRLRKQG
jgi:hypothetical protein